MILTLTSNGSAWGGAALVAGYCTRRSTNARAPATALLLIATLAYYALILLFSQRWRGATLEDGGSAAGQGLASLARIAAFWLAASIIAGTVLGYLGHTIRHGSRQWASVAAGVAFGLLAGEGSCVLLFVPAWRSDTAYGHALFLSATFTIFLAIAATVSLLARRGSGRSWWIFIISAIVAFVLGVLLWRQIQAVRLADMAAALLNVF